jgi:hypothetical protein
MSGYAHIHRRLLGHTAFRNDAEAMAFAWLIVKASWKEARVRYKDRVVELQRGQVAISVRDFAKAMDRDKAWVERLLKRLKSETMIETRNETGVNVVTICKYDEYQADTSLSKTPVDASNETGARQARDTEQEENNSVPKGTGAEPPDPLKELFDLGVSMLKSQGHSERQARSLIGSWRKGRSPGDIVAALVDAKTRSVSNLVEWMPKRLNGTRRGQDPPSYLDVYEREMQLKSAVSN